MHIINIDREAKRRKQGLKRRVMNMEMANTHFANKRAAPSGLLAGISSGQAAENIGTKDFSGEFFTTDFTRLVSESAGWSNEGSCVRSARFISLFVR